MSARPLTLLALTGLLAQAHCGPPTVRLTQEQSATTARLNAISGTSPRDLWAVGEGGAVVHFDGTAWRAVYSGTLRPLHGVSARAPDDVWAVGPQGALHYDGTAWREANQAATTVTAKLQGATLHAVFAAATDDVWAAGERAMARWQGDQWRGSFGGSLTLHGLHARDGHLWAVGDHGIVLHRGEDRQWGLKETPTSAPLYGVTSSGAAVWAVGPGVILHSDGGPFRDRTEDDDDELLGVSTSGGLVWAVGRRGALLRHAGNGWERPERATAADLRAVYSSGATAWAVGDGGVIVRAEDDAAP